MANPATREQLKDYALRSLGAPVIEINVAEEQLEDRLDEAIEYFNINPVSYTHLTLPTIYSV